MGFFAQRLPYVIPSGATPLTGSVRKLTGNHNNMNDKNSTVSRTFSHYIPPPMRCHCDAFRYTDG